MTIPDLIAALEAAEGPSRELDEAIAKLVGALPAEAQFAYIDPEDGSAVYHWSAHDPDHGEYVTGDNLRSYTRSLDAAATLVPDGMVWRCETDYGDLFRAAVSCDRGPFWRDTESDAASVPIALCIACLRALPEATREREA